MIIQQSPNRWSCLPTSFAMVLGHQVGELLLRIGHDGSEIIWPALPEPLRRRSFHIQELIAQAWMLGWSVTAIEARPQLVGAVGVEPLDVQAPWFMQALSESEGVLTGRTLRGQAHAVAWDGRNCYDPNGTIYGVGQFQAGCFWAIKTRW